MADIIRATAFGIETITTAEEIVRQRVYDEGRVAFNEFESYRKIGSKLAAYRGIKAATSWLRKYGDIHEFHGYAEDLLGTMQIVSEELEKDQMES